MKKLMLIIVLVLSVVLYAFVPQSIDISDQVTYEGQPRLDADAIKGLDSLDIKFQMRGGCFAFSSENYAKASNGEAHAANLAQPNNDKFNSNLLGLYLSENEYQNVYKNTIGHTLYLINTTGNKIDVPAQDSRLSIVTEVKDRIGVWTSINYSPKSWCGNSYHDITLGPNEYWEFALPIFTGNYKTKLRYKLELDDQVFVSNSIDAFINIEQLSSKNKQGHTPTNLMDPYDN